MFGNVVYTTTNTHINDITYFDNIIEELPNTLYNMLRILPNNPVENNILNQRETHRIVIEIAPQTWKMGKPKLKL